MCNNAIDKIYMQMYNSIALASTCICNSSLPWPSFPTFAYSHYYYFASEKDQTERIYHWVFQMYVGKMHAIGNKK